jgi:hypothetical protein
MSNSANVLSVLKCAEQGNRQKQDTRAIFEGRVICGGILGTRVEATSALALSCEFKIGGNEGLIWTDLIGEEAAAFASILC